MLSLMEASFFTRVKLIKEQIVKIQKMTLFVGDSTVMGLQYKDLIIVLDSPVLMTVAWINTRHWNSLLSRPAARSRRTVNPLIWWSAGKSPITVSQPTAHQAHHPRLWVVLHISPGKKNHHRKPPCSSRILVIWTVCSLLINLLPWLISPQNDVCLHKSIHHAKTAHAWVFQTLPY